MGRYYNGDIEGKCLFGIQPSNFADRFGQEGTYSYLSYNYSEEDLPDVKKELRKIKKNMGVYYQKLKEFFNLHECYSVDELCKALKISVEKYKYLVREYADYEFGLRLADELKKNGYCSFEVEV